MNLAESLASLRNKLETIAVPSLNEDKGHLDHPEDLIFLGDVTGANRAVDAIVKTVANPKTVTIKWDGYPALIFGRDTNGKFSIMDKHMFNKKDGSSIFSVFIVVCISLAVFVISIFFPVFLNYLFSVFVDFFA